MPPCQRCTRWDREIMLSQWLTVGGDKSKHKWSEPEQRRAQLRLPPYPSLIPLPPHTHSLEASNKAIITLISPSKRPQACLQP